MLVELVAEVTHDLLTDNIIQVSLSDANQPVMMGITIIIETNMINNFSLPFPIASSKMNWIINGLTSPKTVVRMIAISTIIICILYGLKAFATRLSVFESVFRPRFFVLRDRQPFRRPFHEMP